MLLTNRIVLALGLVLLLTLTPLAGPLLKVQADASRGSRSTMYSNDFESGADDWAHGGAKDEWELGDPSDGPGYCHSGSKCWGTDLDSTYESEANAWLQSPSIDLRGAKSAVLYYYQWYDFANLLGLMVDIGYLEVSDDNGINFQYLWDFNGTSQNQGWETVSVDLVDYLDKKVIIRFRLVSDELFEESGWFIDDMNVTTNGTGPGSPQHDLAVTGVVPEPSAPNAGQSTQITVNVKNVGEQDERGAKVSLTVQDAADMTTVFSDSQQLDLIAKGETFKLLFYWKPASSGTFILIGKVSIDGDAVPGNDTYQTKIAVGNYPHNLAIVDMSFKPKDPKVGTTVTISVTVKNLGSEAEKRVRVNLRITTSTDALVFEDMRPIENIEPGAIRIVEFTWTPNVADLFIARANVPPKDDPTLDDNRAEVYILVTKKGVDLAVTGVIVRPKDGGPGMRRTIDVKVMDIGDVNATNVVITYDVVGPSGPSSQGAMNYSVISSGEVKQVLWDIYPDTPGIYTVHVHANTAGDNEPDNDDATTTFSVRSAYRDVGIEAISVIPRAAEIGLARSVLAEVGNYGDIPEAFRTTIRVLDSTNAQVLVKDFDLSLVPGARVNITAEYTPLLYGNYSALATTYLGEDSQHSNDAMNTTFIVSKHQVHDLGIEVLDVDPRTDYTDVSRLIKATISNNGDTTENGQVDFTIFDGSGGFRTNFTRTLSLGPSTVGAVNGTFVPGLVGTFLVQTKVRTIGNTDQQPSNDYMNISVISEPRPPAIDLSVDAIATDPIPGVLGKDLIIIVLVGNLGVQATEGNLKLDILDPNGLSSSLNQNFEIGPKGSAEIRFVMRPMLAGNYSLAVKASVNGGGTDADTGNNVRSSKLQVIDIGTRDAGVVSVVPSKGGTCGFNFTVNIKVQNKGTVDLTGVTVTLDVDGTGQTYTQLTTVDIPKGQTKDIKFYFTAPKTGRYQFTVRSAATGDEVSTNNVMSAWGEACDPKAVDTHTRVDTSVASWAWILLVIIFSVVCLVMYEYYKDKKESKSKCLSSLVEPSSTDGGYREPAQRPAPIARPLTTTRSGIRPGGNPGARPPVRGPQRPNYGGQRPGR